MRKKIKWLLFIIAISAVAWSVLTRNKTPELKKQFSTVPLIHGTVSKTVAATGEIKPLNTVLVGSQVSGNINKIHVDFNDVVKKGDVLLEIDPTVLKDTANEVKASLVSAKSQLKYDEAEYERDQQLFEAGYIARSEMESSKTRFETSQQTVNRIQSQYNRALTNLSYATITSPVNGTIVSRKVDVGQTIAASLSAPDLFEIAEDLSKMQIETAISEADIGLIRKGQAVTFTVDAFPTETFSGTVKQIRLSPTTTQNVVVYTVIIDVDNSTLKLMPGMTAFVKVLIEEHKNVWKVENTAFLTRTYKNILPENESIINGKATPLNTLLILRKDQVVLVPYEKGLNTSTETEIVAKGLQEGDQIITAKHGVSKGSATFPHD